MKGEGTGRTREAAIAAAAKQLGIAPGDAEVTILEERQARLFGLLGSARVRVRVTPRTRARTPAVADGDARSDAERVRQIVAGILSTMGVGAEVRVDPEDVNGRVLVETKDADGLLIGRHGQTLAALQHLANRILTHGRDNRPTIAVDVAGYRARHGDAAGDGAREARPRAAGQRRRSERRARAGAR
jgi:spoIIIJ-associated protein